MWRKPPGWHVFCIALDCPEIFELVQRLSLPEELYGDMMVLAHLLQDCAEDPIGGVSHIHMAGERARQLRQMAHLGRGFRE